jgi:3-hydroxybutyrate dehydrogenase
MAEGFAREGAAVAVTDVNLDAARAVTGGIEERGGRALALLMDVTSEEQVDRGVADAARSLGRLDVAVSNAGVQHIAPITEFTLSDWRRVLSIHLDGGFLLTRAAMRPLAGRGQGRAPPLHGQRAQRRGLAAQGRVRRREAWPAGIGPGRRRRRGRRSAYAPTSSARASSALPLVEKQIPEQAKTLGSQRGRRW